MGQGEAYLQSGKRGEEEGRGNGRTVEGARKRGRWEWSILDNSRILLAGILGSSLHKDHSLPLPLLQCTRSCTDVLSFYFSPFLSLPVLFSLFIVRSSFTFFVTFRRYTFPCSFPSVSSFVGQPPLRCSPCSSGSSAPSLRLFSLVPSACPSRLLYEVIMYRIRYHLIAILGIEKSLVVTVPNTVYFRCDNFHIFFLMKIFAWLFFETFARHCREF